jgi:hypothetical protein
MTRFSTLLIAFAAVIVGCVSYELEWTKRSGFGPTIGPSAKAPMFQRCEQKLMDGARQCALAFEDARGQKIDIFRGLVPAVDSYLQNLPEFKTWPKSNGVPVQTKIPYKLHLLTISPAIVVLVPSPPAQRATCWVDAPEGNCLRSYVAFGDGYDLSDELNLADGARWFALGSTTGLQPLPLDANAFEFPVQGVRARLVKHGAGWRFERLK